MLDHNLKLLKAMWMVHMLIKDKEKRDKLMDELCAEGRLEELLKDE